MYICYGIDKSLWSIEFGFVFHICSNVFGCWLNPKEAEGGSISPIRLSFASIRGGSAEPRCPRLGLDPFRHHSLALTVQYVENVAH